MSLSYENEELVEDLEKMIRSIKALRKIAKYPDGQKIVMKTLKHVIRAIKRR